jgi:2-phosphoglycerate kinase
MKDWKILLIGGSSAVGKSHLAKQLSKEFNIPLLQVDDLRITLQQLVDKNAHPDLYFFLQKPYAEILRDYSSEELKDKLIKLAEAMWPALNAVISKHIVCGEKVIIEGDGIIPDLLTKRDLTDIKTIFIWDSREALLERSKKRGGLGANESFEERQSAFSSSFGDEIKKQALDHDFEVIQASPLDTLFERVMTSDTSNPQQTFEQ